VGGGTVLLYQLEAHYGLLKQLRRWPRILAIRGGDDHDDTTLLATQADRTYFDTHSKVVNSRLARYWPTPGESHVRGL
jgi:hypothetical protein